jgi:CRP-like cAMP-binding protein
MRKEGLGKTYADGDAIITQGEMGDCMFVVQAGEVEVLQDADGDLHRLAVLGPGSFFGEMAIFERVTRSATVRARGEVRVLTVDKRTLLRRIKKDPLLAFNILRTMSGRIRELNAELLRASGQTAVAGQAKGE